MESLDITERTLLVLTELSGLEGFGEDAELAEDLGLDSLSMVSLLVRVEEYFGFELRESDMDPTELHTVKDVIGLVEQYIKEAA